MKSALLPVALLALGCATVQPSRPLYTPADYAKLGLTEGVIAPWEDGLRTDGGPGTYEWWYLDAHLEDGTAVVVGFYTKSMLEVGGGLQPVITVNVDRPDGGTSMEVIEFKPSEFSASTTTCDVRLGNNRLHGDLTRYELHLDTPTVKADLTLTGTVKPWRAATGVLSFGEKEDKYFAWLPAVPDGQIEGTLSLGNDAPVTVRGTGYHDHNWGNAPIGEVMHHWYWGRARVGPYSVIASEITADDRYSGTRFPIFMIARGETLLVQESPQVKVTASEVALDDHTHKPVASRLVYELALDGKRYRVTFARKKDLLRKRLLEAFPPVLRFFAGLAGFDGAYLRFTGDVTVELFDGDQLLDAATNDAAVWELMYLGKTPPEVK